MKSPPSVLRAKMAESRLWRDKRHLPERFRVDVLAEVRRETQGILRGAYGRSVRLERKP